MNVLKVNFKDCYVVKGCMVMTMTSEASTLGLKPGEWPLHVQVGEGPIMNRTELTDHGANYRARGGEQLYIYND